MSHLATLINDLALILICAGIMTLLFKKLKQPLVLGYVVAGFLASPHMPYTPSVMDTANIQTWADIGVIFLLFALGLEFSFKKIVKVGGAAIIAACTIIFCMILLRITVGTGFGWQRMDSIFLGGMIAMSSTTIIYKAFDDLGMRKKQFTGLVLSVLILEDILAIVLMVMLSTMAVRHNFEGSEMLESIGKLLFFLILWFVVGIYLIPELLKRCRKLMSEETLLIVSLGLCFGMVVMAAHTGFSAAFGAFIMGSILAETVEAESIERLVKPVKDLFGAIFIVSVGLSLDVFTYALYKGAMLSRLDKKQILKMILLFTGWQSGAMLLGSLISELPYIAMNYQRTERLFRAASAVIFFLIGIWLIVRALHMRDPLERREDAFAWRQLCIWAMLTSVDSFLTGIGMGFLDTRVTVQIIQLAIMAALAVIAGIYAGYRIGCHGRNRVLISGALIFLLAGVDVLFRYYI